jgi:hypothetical protein
MFKNIENQLIDRYIRRKPLVNTESMPLFEYSDEIHDYEIFKRLEVASKQTQLDALSQLNLVREFETINEISEELNILKIVINYASATSVDSDTTVASFVKKIYPGSGQTGGVLRSKTIEACRLKHLKHIWILLNLKRCILYTINKQVGTDT